MSHRGDLTERMVLIPLLLAEHPRSQQDLARHFSVSGKTIKRDIDALSHHYPIVEVREGRELRYSFSGGYRYQPPSFAPAEVAPLLLAQQSIAATGLTGLDSPFHAYAESMLAKVRASLPPALREQLDAMAEVFGTAAVSAKDFSRHAVTVDVLTRAAINQRSVRISYYTLNTDKTRERTVDPYSVYFDPDGATLKLIAFDHYRKKILPFSVDHIRSVKQTNEGFTRPADFDLREFLAENCFNGIHGDPVTVRLRAKGVTARVFAERTFHSSQRLIERTPGTASDAPARKRAEEVSQRLIERTPGTAGDERARKRAGEASQRLIERTPSPREESTATERHEESTTIEMRVASGRGLVRFILSWAPDVEVLSPPELRREVAEAHRSALGRLV